VRDDDEQACDERRAEDGQSVEKRFISTPPAVC
jgi:hypothetical protein